MMWITSYASLFHRPGVPLFDLIAADFTTDPAYEALKPAQRANPSMGSWPEGKAYLDQQQRRLPAYKYRRLHLNLPGQPEGSAFQPEPVMSAISRGVKSRPPEHHFQYRAFVDMSGGSSDDAILAISHQDVDGRTVLDRILNPGQAPPFDPRKASRDLPRP